MSFVLRSMFNRLLSSATAKQSHLSINGSNLVIFEKSSSSFYSTRKGFLLAAATMIVTDETKNDTTKTAIAQAVNSANNLNQNSFIQIKQKQQMQQQQQLHLQQQQCHQYQQMRHFSSLQNRNSTLMQRDNTVRRRTIVTHEITKQLTLVSEKPRNVDIDNKTLKLKEQIERPMVLLFGWMLAKKKNLSKYAKIYTDLGFDVLTVEVTPWQLLWPVKGTQIIAYDVLKFLDSNPLYKPIVLHGFSVGGYVWGEVMVHMTRELDRYKPILDRIAAQVWDSAADITEISIGLPKAIFPKNQTLQKALRNYTIYHLKTFHEQATCHYIRSSQMFHSPLAKAPALFLLSKNDPIGAEKSNLSVKESMESIGIKCTWKCWDRSGHTLHFRYHRDEYMKYLLEHLEANVMGLQHKKSQAKMQ